VFTLGGSLLLSSLAHLAAAMALIEVRLVLVAEAFDSFTNPGLGIESHVFD